MFLNSIPYHHHLVVYICNICCCFQSIEPFLRSNSWRLLLYRQSQNHPWDFLAVGRYPVATGGSRCARLCETSLSCLVQKSVAGGWLIPDCPAKRLAYNIDAGLKMDGMSWCNVSEIKGALRTHLRLASVCQALGKVPVLQRLLTNRKVSGKSSAGIAGISN